MKQYFFLNSNPETVTLHLMSLGIVLELIAETLHIN